MVNGNNSNNENPKRCNICKNISNTTKKTCPASCSVKTCKTCYEKWNRSSGTCSHCRAPTGTRPANQIRAAAAREAAREAPRPVPTRVLVESADRVITDLRRAGRPTAHLNDIVAELRAGRFNDPGPIIERLRQALVRGWTNDLARARGNDATMHSGGLVRSTKSFRLLKNEIVLSRAQRKGFTHGQIVKILAKYRREILQRGRLRNKTAASIYRE